MTRERECRYCGDEDFEPELYADPEGVVCRSGGCGFLFESDEIDPEDLAFGFHVVTLADIAAEAEADSL